MVKSMLHEDKRDLETGRGCSKLEGTIILSFACTQVIHEQKNEVTVSRS